MAKDYNAFYTSRCLLDETNKWAKVFGLKLNNIVQFTEWLNFEIELCSKQSNDISSVPSIKKYIVTISTHTYTNGTFIKRDSPLINITDHNHYELENIDLCCIYDDDYINFYVKCNNANEFISGILKHCSCVNLFTYFNYEKFETDISTSTANSVFVNNTICQKIPIIKDNGSTTVTSIPFGTSWTKINDGYIWGSVLYDCVVSVITTFIISNDTDGNVCDIFLDLYNKNIGSSTDNSYKYIGKTSVKGTNTITTVISKSFKKGDIIKYDLYARCNKEGATATVDRFRLSAIILPGNLS